MNAFVIENKYRKQVCFVLHEEEISHNGTHNREDGNSGDIQRNTIQFHI